MGKQNQGKWIMGGAIAAGGLLLAGGFFLAQSNFSPRESEPVAETMPEITTVTALGYLEPAGEVVQLSAPMVNQSSRLEKLFVEVGDRLEVGQVVAILDAYPRLQAALNEADQQIKVAQAQLDRVKAGAKQGEIAAQQAEINRLAAQYQGEITAQQATVRRLEAEVSNAQAEYERYQSLFQAGAMSESQRDSKKLLLETARTSLQEAQANLARLQNTTPATLERAQATLFQIAEVRPVDIQVAQADLDRAIANRDQAAANLEEAVVYASIAGEVLDIFTRPGEVVGTQGILAVGQTDQMRAIAEIYQSDINQVQLGQRATVTSSALQQHLTGTVTRIGSQVLRQSVVNTDPSDNIDARVIEVEIELDAESRAIAADFTNLQIQVEIQQ